MPKLPRGLFFTKSRIPGVNRDDDDGLIAGREAPGYESAVSRGRRRQGARTTAQIADDDAIRGAGVPVFDRKTGTAELGGYIARGSGRR